MVDSFKVYLPSNASPLTYPHNTSSSYQTHLDRALDLQGEWEVGVESVFYASNLTVKKRGEEVKIECNLKAVSTPFSVVRSKSKKFALNRKIKWNGMIEIKPSEDLYETDPNTFGGVIQTLNSLNSQVVEGNVKAFTFTKHSFHLQRNLKHFYLTITPPMSAVLGYPKNFIFGTRDIIARNKYKKRDTEKLTRNDYTVYILNADPKYKEARMKIKAPKLSFAGGKEAFLKLWKEKVKGYNIVTFFKSDKLIIDNFENNKAIILSPDLANAVGHDTLIFGRSTKWASQKSNLKKGHAKENWYIDIFSIHSQALEKEFSYNFSVNIFREHYQFVKYFINDINRIMEKEIVKTVTIDNYNADNHRFHLSVNDVGHVELALGKWIKPQFSVNLLSLLGMTESSLKESKPYGITRIDRKRDQQLFILSNIAEATSYGQRSLQILQSFLHKEKAESVREKRFEPVVYLPLMSNYINMIEIQVTDENYEPIDLKDFTTIVCLYFRKSDRRA